MRSVQQDLADPSGDRLSDPRMVAKQRTPSCGTPACDPNPKTVEALGLSTAFLFSTASLAAGGWILTYFKHYRFMPAVLCIGLIGAAFFAKRTSGSWQKLWREIRDPFAFAPALGLVVVLLIAAFMNMPMMLDALTYRLPRILLWLEAGGVYHVGTVEARLDFLCPVWEFCTTPFVQIFGVRAGRVWSLVSWAMCHVLYFHWAMMFTNRDEKRSRILALLANTSTFALLQAASAANDILAVAFLLLGIQFVLYYESHREGSSIRWAALALALATGVKPHFATLGAPFVLWLLLAKSRPILRVRWAVSLLILPFLLLCSAVPTFVLNQKAYGAPLGPVPKEVSFSGKSPAANVVLASGMMVWQCLQPSPNPFALFANEPLETLVKKSGLTALHQRFTLRMTPVHMADTASLGLVTSVLFLAGLWRGIRPLRERFKLPITLIAVSGLFGFLAAATQFVPGTVGRSSLGFVLLATPLVICGWATLSYKQLRIGLILALASSVLAIVLNPSKPLWPAETLHNWLVESGRTGLAGKFKPYLLVRERARAGVSLVQQIPKEEPFFVALIAEDRPLLPMMLTERGAGGVKFLPENASIDQLKQTAARYVVLCDPDQIYYPILSEYLRNGGDYELAAEATYVAVLQRGPATWQLFRKREQLNSAP